MTSDAIKGFATELAAAWKSAGDVMNEVCWVWMGVHIAADDLGIDEFSPEYSALCGSIRDLALTL